MGGFGALSVWGCLRRCHWVVYSTFYRWWVGSTEPLRFCLYRIGVQWGCSIEGQVLPSGVGKDKGVWVWPEAGHEKALSCERAWVVEQEKPQAITTVNVHYCEIVDSYLDRWRWPLGLCFMWHVYKSGTQTDAYICWIHSVSTLHQWHICFQLSHFFVKSLFSWTIVQ